MKPYAAACDENRDPILGVLRGVLPESARVLELGSGTGQHAVYFAAQLPGVRWVCTDLPDQLPGIAAWMAEAALPNLEGPLELDVSSALWAAPGEADAVFSANTAHILHGAGVESMFRGVGRCLAAGAPFILYGPFRYAESHTSESNRRFDAWLKARDPASGVRDAHWLDELAREAGMQWVEDRAMPANNRTLIYRKL